MLLGNRSLKNVRQLNLSLRSFSALPRQAQPSIVFVDAEQIGSKNVSAVGKRALDGAVYTERNSRVTGRNVAV
ncbi:hypothetical protein L596_025123 [Steinernema carpocapsae]|uniref:Uncharacterized protein n=1 Tax=Steinernema carpocapsae TaxID=34508 RepID=A0A4V5ZYQ4_STECR|nr:hypothetical protein L596_025123 [Steinernema carpocapsae]